jgi:hypothetical protein
MYARACELDIHLPSGGLPLGHLHEVIEGGPASEYAGIATLFIAGILARIPGPVLWCLRGRDLFAPALARIGLHPDRVIYCETWKDRDVLPAMEEGLRCAGLAGVVGEVTRLSLTASRRLQLCAGQSGVTALALRRWHNTTEKAIAGEPTNFAGRIVRPHLNRSTHGKRPPFATLNHTARDSRIPRESDNLRVGIRVRHHPMEQEGLEVVF